MTDNEIYDALCGLVRSQLEEVLLVAGVPDHHIPPSEAPIASRANALIVWIKQSPDHRENLIKALDGVQQRAGVARTRSETHIRPEAFILPPVDTEGFAGRKTELQQLIDLLIEGTPLAGGRINSRRVWRARCR